MRFFCLWRRHKRRANYRDVCRELRLGQPVLHRAAGTYKLLYAASQVRRRKCVGFVLLTIGNACFV